MMCFPTECTHLNNTECINLLQWSWGLLLLTLELPFFVLYVGVANTSKPHLIISNKPHPLLLSAILSSCSRSCNCSFPVSSSHEGVDGYERGD